MKKLLIALSFLIMSGNLCARSAWRVAQMTGKTPRSAGHQARRAASAPVRSGRRVSGVVAREATGFGSGARDSIAFADEHYFRGRTPHR